MSSVQRSSNSHRLVDLRVKPNNEPSKSCVAQPLHCTGEHSCKPYFVAQPIINPRQTNVRCVLSAKDRLHRMLSGIDQSEVISTLDFFSVALCMFEAECLNNSDAFLRGINIHKSVEQVKDSHLRFFCLGVERGYIPKEKLADVLLGIGKSDSWDRLHACDAYSKQVEKLIQRNKLSEVEIYEHLDRLVSNKLFDELHSCLSVAIDRKSVTDWNRVKQYCRLFENLATVSPTDIIKRTTSPKTELYTNLYAKAISSGLAPPDEKENCLKYTVQYRDDEIKTCVRNKIFSQSEFNRHLGDQEVYLRDEIVEKELYKQKNLLEFQMLGYKAGYISEKPDYNPIFEEVANADNNNKTRYFYELLCSAVENTVIINEQELRGKLEQLLNLDYNFSDSPYITDKVEAAKREKAEMFNGVVLLAMKEGLISDINPYVQMLENKFGGDYGAGLFYRAIKDEVIVDRNEINYYLDYFESRVDTNMNLNLFFEAYKANAFKPDANEIRSVMSEHPDLPLIVSLGIEDLKTLLNLDEGQTRNIDSRVREVLTKIRNLNETAERDDQRIDLSKFELFTSTGLAKMLAVDEKAANNIINDHLNGRRFLPMFSDIVDKFALLDPNEIKQLNLLCQSHRALLDQDPNFLVDLVRSYEAYKTLGISHDGLTPLQSFEKDGQGESSTSQDLANKFGVTVVEELCSKRFLNLDVDSKSMGNKADLLKRFDLRYLGPLLSTRNKWTPEDKNAFELLLRSTIQGNLNGLLDPTSYEQIPVAVYGEDKQAIVTKIRAHNSNFLQELNRLGLNPDVWLHPNNHVSPKRIEGEGLRRRAVKIIQDFRGKFDRFSTWLEGGFEKDELFIKLGDTQKGELRKLVKNFWHGVKDELTPLTSKKQGDLSVRVMHIKNMDLKKAKYVKFLQSLSLFFKNQVPEEIADTKIILSEMRQFNPNAFKNQKFGKNYGIRFWYRDPLKEYSLGNRAGSCTSLGMNSQAIFNFFQDLGTQYLVLVDPEKNDLGYVDSTNSVQGDPIGYTRFFLGENDKNEPVIFCDTIDGVGAVNNVDLLKKHLQEFASKLGIQPDDEHIIVRNFNTVAQGLKSKVGGALPGYFHHSGLAL